MAESRAGSTALMGHLRGRGITDAPDDVVRVTASVLNSLRRSLDAQKYLEVITPVLQAVSKSPFVEPLQVTLSDEHVATRAGIVRRAETHAQLSSVPGGYLQGLLPRVGPVYTIAPMFRGELVPTWLTEFRYVQAAGRGGLDDAMRLAVSLIGDVVKAVQKEKLAVSDRARKFDNPVRLSYADAIKRVGGVPGEPLSHDQYRELAAAHDDRPVFVVGVPLHLEPYAALGARMMDDGPAFFEIVVPDAGEVGAGKEYETGYDAFIRTAEGAHDYARRIGMAWHERAELEAVGELISALPSPSFSFGLGLERLVQYVIGARDVGRAVAFPVVNGAAFRRPVLME